jgi:hypothetical protein
MTFTEALIAANYVLDEENFDEGCYVKTDADNLIHVYQMGEDEGEWNYVKMNEDFDVLLESTFVLSFAYFDPDSNTVFSLIP